MAQLVELRGFEGVDLDLHQVPVFGDEPRRAGVGGLAGLRLQVVVADLFGGECDSFGVVQAPCSCQEVAREILAEG